MEEDKMRHMMSTLFMMIAVGMFAFVSGWNLNAQLMAGPHVVDLVEIGQPHLVLAKSGTRQQKEARQQIEGCPLTPNGDLGQQRITEQERSIMKGLVF
jgi:hypothetical protein